MAARSLEALRKWYLEMTADREQFAQDMEEYGDELLRMLEFGTGGMRGLMRSGFGGINEVTCNLLGTELSKRYASVVIGCDGRHNSLEHAMLLKMIFEERGRQVWMHLHIPTPFLAFIVRRLGAEAGVMVTASHNPKEYNGFKVYSSEGCQIGPPLDAEIEEALNRLETTTVEYGDIGRAAKCSLGTLSGEERSRLIDEYNACMFCRWDTDLIQRISNVGTSVPVVFTGLCGVSGEFVRAALEFYRLDGSVHFVEEECRPDPDFPGLPFPNPEFGDALGRAKQSCLADIVFACDPDGDRFGLSERIGGEWVDYNGNEIAAMFMYFFVRNFDPATLAFVNTFLCNGLMEKVSKTHGIAYSRTETGFKNVSRAVAEAGQKHVLAYEDSLGFLFGQGLEKDGVKCVVLMMYLVQKMLPSVILDEMHVYGRNSSVNVHLRSEDPQRLLDDVLKRLPDAVTEGKRSTVLRETHRIVLRVSGTEPILKIYASSETLDKRSLSDAVQEFVRTYIEH